ncbi:hypothetical protein KPH14_013066, partial [Odynerus spinipes]
TRKIDTGVGGQVELRDTFDDQFRALVSTGDFIRDENKVEKIIGIVESGELTLQGVLVEQAVTLDDAARVVEIPGMIATQPRDIVENIVSGDGDASF